MTAGRRTSVFGLALLGAAACARYSTDASSVVSDPRIIAVVAEPAEARPGSEVTLALHAADADGPLEDFAFSAYFCLLPKPLTENNALTAACWNEPGAPLPLQDSVVHGVIPKDACALFGPDPPPGDFRPRDPDHTGGFFVPVLIEAFDRRSVFLQRVRCEPADLRADVAREYAARYADNQNPVGLGLALHPRDASGALRAEVTLPFAAAERFVVASALSQTVEETAEVLTVEWLVTQGTLSVATAELVEQRGVWVAEVDWDHAGPDSAHLYAVVRDSRGGMAFAAREAPR